MTRSCFHCSSAPCWRSSGADTRPVLTLTTDFGTADAFVGVMKGVILGIAPDVAIVDLTHAIAPQDVLAGALQLRAAVPYFPPGTIHVAVVDPGVGTARRALVVETRDALFVAPDNGLVSLAAPARAIVRVVDVTRSRHRLASVSRTFHGRDVFAPIAARLAAGLPPARLGRPTRGRIVRLRIPHVRRTGGGVRGEVIAVDHFGNLTTNVGRDDLAAIGAFRGGRVSVTIDARKMPLRDSYADAPAGDALAVVNSTGLLEIAVARGSAARALGVDRGARVDVDVR